MPTSHPRGPQAVVAILLAGGRGARFGEGAPKQYRLLGGKTVLRRSMEAFAHHPDITSTMVVIHPDDRAAYDQSALGLRHLLPPALGGRSRQESVLKGLDALELSASDIVLIHDAARPFVSPELISRVVDAARDGRGAVPAMPTTDTLKRVSAGKITGTIPRNDVVAVQTPQGFRFGAILQAHRQAEAAGLSELTDDAAVAEAAGESVGVVQGDAGNVKITTAGDLERASLLLATATETRTGQGFDVHAFGDGNAVWLCGIRIPHPRALQGHSDADVGLHALTDAVLGALCDGDIGEHFPPSDPAWKGASSDRFLAHAVEHLASRGGRVINLDVTLVCEAPKISPYRDEMRSAIARIAGVAPGRVSVKATTSERLGFAGREEGIAALAVATIQVPVPV